MANAVQFAFGIAITALSFSAYLSSGRKTAFGISTIGFLLITFGGMFAPVYELGIKGDYNITGRELLELQIVEGTLIAFGLACLLYSIYSHSSNTRRVAEELDADFEELDADVYSLEERESP